VQLATSTTPTLGRSSRDLPGALFVSLVTQVSQAADVYSFGVLLVALFSGEVSWGVPLPHDASERVLLLRTLSMSGVRPVLPSTTKVCMLPLCL
jgi:hypothetical protein